MQHRRYSSPRALYPNWSHISESPGDDCRVIYDIEKSFQTIRKNE